MDDTEATEPTNQSEATADAASVKVPNIRDGARSGLDHEPLTPRKTTLLGRHTATDSYDDGEHTVTETITGDGTGVALPPADQGGEETGPEGTPIGDAAETASGEGSSDAAGSETPASDDTTSGEQPAT